LKCRNFLGAIARKKMPPVFFFNGCLRYLIMFNSTSITWISLARDDLKF
jgi:hypothetical protein